MNEKQLILMFVLFLCAFSRPIIMRKCAISLDPKTAPSFVSIWVLIACIAIFPFFGDMLTSGLQTSIEKPLILLIGITKGISLWGCVVIGQKMLAVSASSSIYRAPIAVGFIAIGAFLQGEVLTTIQWFSVGALFCLGIAFVLKGHLSTLAVKYKILFAVSVLISIVPAMCDQAVIPQTNWYTLLFLSGIGMLICSAFMCRNFKVLKQQVSTPRALIAGAVWAIGEVIILSIIVTHVPITMAVMAMTMAVPTNMIISSLVWKEGSWVQQGAFGIAAYIATIPMILA